MAVMDSRRWQRASPHLDHILDLPPADQADYLSGLSGSEPEVATDVAALLEQHRLLSAEGFLNDSAPAAPVAPALAGGSTGAYTLREPIGQGGMGSVWLAERNDGRFEGTAAVKLLNADLIGRSGGERFKREGTILARLAHPNIARLIDAGVSSHGQPYLVLEHVSGSHIDQYCDERMLDTEGRVRLFLDVLSAVAHAHANLIVHRDLKPSNVLVTDQGAVKLLDFGIAKLLEHENQTGEPTLTRDAGAGLTPKYAAPEQVTGGPITTATDVYALGVLLYELLTGLHPIGPLAQSPADIVKAIVETDPPKPSATTTFAAGPRAARRGTTPDRLRRALQDDLDTIVAKALKKDPAERYLSVAELADDLRRFVDHQPIAARPDSLRYRGGKFVRRHRRSVAAAAAAVMIVAGVAGFYTVQLARERDRAAVEAAKASRISELLTGLLTGADPFRTPDAQEPTVRNLLDRGVARVTQDLAGQPELQAEMFTVIGRTFGRMGLHDKALPLLEQALALGRGAFGGDHEKVGQSLNDLGVLQRQMGNLPASQALLEESLAMRRRLFGDVHKDVAVTLVELSRTLDDRGRGAEAEPLSREALAVRRQVFGDEHRETATSKSDLALLLRDQGDLDGAEILFREALATNIRLLGAEHPNTGAGKNNLALVLSAKGDLAGAEVLLREALAINRATVGPAHLGYANALNNLSSTIRDQGRIDEARPMIEEAVRVAREAVADDHPRVAIYRVSLARLHLAAGEPAAAEPILRDVLQVREKLYPANDWRIGQVKSLLGASLMAQGRLADAEPLMREAAEVLKPVAGGQGKEYQANSERLARLDKALGR
ncbi:MAG: tetratricopeptide repeat protein [Vicinamibacterales bacterium]